MGGSQGARSINMSAPNALATLNSTMNIKVVHDTEIMIMMKSMMHIKGLV